MASGILVVTLDGRFLGSGGSSVHFGLSILLVEVSHALTYSIFVRDLLSALMNAVTLNSNKESHVCRVLVNQVTPTGLHTALQVTKPLMMRDS